MCVVPHRVRLDEKGVGIVVMIVCARHGYNLRKAAVALLFTKKPAAAPYHIFYQR